MATTQITKKLKESLIHEINLLLGRGHTAFHCPLDVEAQRLFWHNMLPPEDVKAYFLLRARGYEVGGLDINHAELRTVVEGRDVDIRFYQGNYSAFIVPPYNTTGSRGQYHARPPELVAKAFPGNAEVFAAFRCWVINCAVVDRDFNLALPVLTEILEFCGTVGQLTRAVPDISRYLTPETQGMLRDQARASNMPYEWGAFDRSRVDNLQFCMAKAHLMPRATGGWSSTIATGASFALPGTIGS